MAFFKKNETGKMDINIEYQQLAERIEFLTNKSDSLELDLENLKGVVFRLLDEINSEKLKPNSPSQLTSRIEDLELWRTKIHNLAVEITPVKKQEKLTRFGHRITRSWFIFLKKARTLCMGNFYTFYKICILV